MKSTRRVAGKIFGWSLLTGALLSLASCAVITQPLVSPLPPTTQRADPARLEAHVRYLTETVYPRSFDQLAHLNAAADYIKQSFQQSGGRVSEQPFTVEDAQYRNIIARYGPDDGPVIVIGAHYDSFADVGVASQTGKSYGPDTHTPGADDNASGTAGLLELARMLQQHPPRIGVELVAYSLEEPPFFRTDDMGSVHHARSLVASGRSVQAVVVLEMIGYFDEQPDSQDYPLSLLRALYPDRGNYIAVIGRGGDWSAVRRVKAALMSVDGLPVYSMNAPSLVQGVDFSDHRSYWPHGIPAVMVTDSAFYRNKQYHQADDSADRLNYPRMAQVVQGVYALLEQAQ